MLKYDWKKETPEMEPKEAVILFQKNKKESFEYAMDHLGDITDIFSVQLEKAGHSDRKKAVEEIVKVLVGNHYAKYKITHDVKDYSAFFSEAELLVDIANIIDSVNNGDNKMVDHLLSEVNSKNNHPIEINNSWRAMKFSYWIMSDEDREKYHDIFYRHVLNHDYCKDSHVMPEKIIREFESLKDLSSLTAHNKLTSETIGVKE